MSIPTIANFMALCWSRPRLKAPHFNLWIAFALTTPAPAAESPPLPTPMLKPEVVLAVPDLVSFWDFQEPAGADCIAKGPHPYRLREVDGPIERIEEGVFGRAARIRRGQWFRCPRGEFPALDIHGPKAQVSVAAWIRRESTANWQAIAGVWDESRSKRQYYLFLNATTQTDFTVMKRFPCRDLVHGHVSAVGGPTPGEKFCITYATGATPTPQLQWTFVGMSYDGEFARVYVDGKLDRSERHIPFPYSDGLFDGADLTVGSNSVSGKPSNFFAGSIGGLAIFRRSLSPAEWQSLSLP